MLRHYKGRDDFVQATAWRCVPEGTEAGLKSGTYITVLRRQDWLCHADQSKDANREIGVPRLVAAEDADGAAVGGELDFG
jgi:hypothetical protein